MKTTNYENAPATKLLATSCACCGRALVDAVSVESGMGPDCRERFGSDVVVSSAAHDEANVLVHAVARKGVSKVEAKNVIARLAQLGFDVLAARIAKRFRETVEEPVAIEELRAQYRRARRDFAYDNSTAAEFDALVAATDPKCPQDFVDAAHSISCDCGRCAGTGHYIAGGMQTSRDCFRCGGKGRQDLADARRNRAYDAYQASRRAS